MPERRFNLEWSTWVSSLIYLSYSAYPFSFSGIANHNCYMGSKLNHLTVFSSKSMISSCSKTGTCWVLTWSSCSPRRPRCYWSFARSCTRHMQLHRRSGGGWAWQCWWPRPSSSCAWGSLGHLPCMSHTDSRAAADRCSTGCSLNRRLPLRPESKTSRSRRCNRMKSAACSIQTTSPTIHTQSVNWGIKWK